VRLTTVGTGTAALNPARARAGHLVEAGTTRLLLDCGSGLAMRLAERGMDWMGITHIAVTHFHDDHIGDLPTMLTAWRWGALPPRAAPLALIGPPGTRALQGALAAVYGDIVTVPGFPLVVSELASGESMELPGGVRIAARTVPHTPESVAYSIEHGGRRLVYTGDTGFDASLGEWASGCDVLLCECSLPDALAIPGHLTPRQCGRLAAVAAPRQLVLTHFYPPVEAVDIRAEVAESFAGAVVLAHDGWTIELRG
jgi:ribonuclease BN (tRNA processing enzyme)